MARHPQWFEQLDSILAALAQTPVEWLGRAEIRALFRLGERDAIRLLHCFGAEQRNNALSLPRPALLTQLEAIRNGSTYAAFLAKRRQVARHLAAARSENAARQFPVRLAEPAEALPSLDLLPSSITWRRTTPQGPARFEILYQDGADLMTQIAEFLTAASANRAEFCLATEPAPPGPES